MVLETTIVERKQNVGLGVIQSFDAGIITIGVETVVAPNIYVVRRGILIGSATKLGNKSNEISVIRNLNPSSALPIITTRVFDTLQMVFTHPITINHVNKTAN
jgi:hypothetical protein